MLKSKGKEGVIALCLCDGPSIDSDRVRVIEEEVEEEVVEVEVVVVVDEDEDDREGFECAILLFFKILCNSCIAVMTS